MKNYTTREVRRLFIEYFVKAGHIYKKSVPLTHTTDPSLLFNNSGMSPWKPYFSQVETAPHKCLTTVQHCLRVGGKHNDIDEVGTSPYHHTFFEMCGNFSFGDYSIDKAIHYSSSFLINVLGLDVKRLLISLHPSLLAKKDVWRQNMDGLQVDQLYEDKDNWWSAGESGVCGPCTEIYYLGDNHAQPLEIWNIVSIEFHRSQNGLITPLEHTSVDTGMGLERVVSVVQKVSSTYATDTFRTMSQSLEHFRYDEVTLKMTLDHIKSVVFLLVEKVKPSSQQRGYILRKLMRRLMARNVALSQCVSTVLPLLEEAYPEFLQGKTDQVVSLCQEEERRFNSAIERGRRAFVTCINKSPTLSMIDAFYLYETYGLDTSMIKNLADEHSVAFCPRSFASYKKQRTTKEKVDEENLQDSACATQRIPNITTVDTTITSLYTNDWCYKDTLTDAKHVYIGLKATPFYFEAGGQVGDNGTLIHGSNELTITDCILHKGKIMHRVDLMQTTIKVGDTVTASIDVQRRQQVAQHHSSIHLMHAMLTQVLGTQVAQAGSKADDNKASLDFEYDRSLTQEQIRLLEDKINQVIELNLPTQVYDLDLHTATQRGYVLARDTYPSTVRIIQWGDISTEACCGTHVQSLGELRAFRILSCSKKSAGVTRIIGVAGAKGLSVLREHTDIVRTCSTMLSTSIYELANTIKEIQAKYSKAVRHVDVLEKELFAAACKSNLHNSTTASNHCCFFGTVSMYVPLQLLIRKVKSMTKQKSNAIVLLAQIKSQGSMQAILHLPINLGSHVDKLALYTQYSFIGSDRSLLRLTYASASHIQLTNYIKSL